MSLTLVYCLNMYMDRAWFWYPGYHRERDRPCSESLHP